MALQILPPTTLPYGHPLSTLTAAFEDALADVSYYMHSHAEAIYDCLSYFTSPACTAVGKGITAIYKPVAGVAAGVFTMMSASCKACCLEGPCAPGLCCHENEEVESHDIEEVFDLRGYTCLPRGLRLFLEENDDGILIIIDDQNGTVRALSMTVAWPLKLVLTRTLGTSRWKGDNSPERSVDGENSGIYQSKRLRSL